MSQPSHSPTSEDSEDALFDYLFKLVVVGDAGVGKTSLVGRYADENFNENYICTIGVDFRIKTLHIDGKTIKLQLWDTAGQERFRAIVSAYYRSAHGVIIVYDVSSQEHFQNVEHWLGEVNRYAVVDHINKLIIGTKCDLNDIREVPYDVGKRRADSLNIPFIETSAKDGTNVKEAFYQLVAAIKKRVDSENEKPSQIKPSSNTQFTMRNTKPVPQKKQCC